MKKYSLYREVCDIVRAMGVRFVEKIRAELDVSHYKLAKLIGVTQQAVRLWTGVTKAKRPQTGMDLRALCKLRKLSKKTWNQLGAELDKEFLKDD